MKKIIITIFIFLLIISALAFTPTGNSQKKDTIANLKKQINELRIQVADLNSRLTKLETTLIRIPVQKKKKGRI